MKIFNKYVPNLPANLSLIQRDEIQNFVNRIFDDLRDEEKALIAKIDLHHEATLVHSLMVAHDVEYIATRLSYSKEEVKALTIAALLHDAGKLKIHDTVLDLGDKFELEKIWKFSYPKKAFPKNPMMEITVSDLINYKAKFESKDENMYIFKYLEWMKEREVSDFLNQPLRVYLEYHQEGTRIELEKIGVSSDLIKYAAAHHPTYFTEDLRGKLPKEAKIIEIADKFNAIMQTEGIRHYATKKTRTEAMLIIIEALEKKYAKHSLFFESFEEEIMKILVEKYFTKDDVLKDLVPKVKSAIENGEKIYDIKETEKLIALLIVIISFSKEFDEALIHDLYFMENKLLDILDIIKEKTKDKEYKLAA